MRKKFSLEMIKSVCHNSKQLTNEEQCIYLGGGDGSLENPYSMDEYFAMLDSGTWTGGYIQDSDGVVSYGMTEARVYGGGYYNYAGTYIGSTSEYIEYTMTSFILSMENSGWEQFIEAFGGVVDPTGYCDYMNQELTDLKIRLAAKASEQGYSGDDSFDYVVSKVGECTWKVSLVDTITGKTIGSETINMLGL